MSRRSNRYDHAVLVVRGAVLLAVASVALAAPMAAVETERIYLSGTGYGDTREWEFRIEDGRRADEGWTTIPVPSQWELEGFGTYRYGRHDGSGGETGHYRHRFEAPPEWRGRRVRLVFGGVMTDTEARLNGLPVGPVHRGGFTRFSYDVTGLLGFGEENLLEVRVAEKSADRSVEKAERQGDYWVFGGIYRPVWLEASPETTISHVAIDARHDGRLTAVVELEGAVDEVRVVARVHHLDGRPLGREFGGRREESGEPVRLGVQVRGALPWSAERPRLYELRLRLVRGSETLHVTSRRFGFRTFEVRYGEGLFVNGWRVLLRGINRHSFWPDSGRTLNDEINRRDAELLKELNANAVRASHYPPDEAFLDACDELGLYVIDELPGWHDAYDTGVGEKLVAEMVRRDVNHPSIVFWANGNEGGWNAALDDDFHTHDPQRRPVLHPDDVRVGIHTFHYPSRRDLRDALSDETVANRVRAWLGRSRLVMPTEMLHGLYDGGLGAGLEGFWRLLRRSPRGAGGFLWAFLDEGVVRTDRGGELDTFGNYGPDGLVGPYREKEASFRAVRRVWSPIQMRAVRAAGRFDGVLEIENRFSEIDLEECRFEWRALGLPAPGGEIEVLATGASPGPRVPPGGTGRLHLRLPAAPFDALEVVALAPGEREVETWTFQVAASRDLMARWVPHAGEPVGAVAPPPAARAVELRTGRRAVELEDGLVRGLTTGSWRVPLAAGPRPVRAETPRLLEGRHRQTEGREVYTAVYAGGLEKAAWTLHDSGWLRLEIEYPRLARWLQGVAFDLPERWIESIEWLGRGPDPVWLNRLAGPRLGLWRQTLAETAPGRPARGFYDAVRWMRLVGREGVLTVVPEGDDLFVGVSAPGFDESSRNAVAEVPAANTLTFLHRISPIGTKFHRAGELVWSGLYEKDPPSTRLLSLWFFWEQTGDSSSMG